MEYLIASRRGRPGDDPIFALNAEAKRRKAAGEDVVNATIGALLDDDGKLMVMPAVAEALASVEPEVMAAYAPIPGRPDYRKAVIDDLLGAHGLADQSVSVATPGGSGALRMAIEDFLDRGQTLLTSSYFWGPYRTLCDEAGCNLDTFNMLDETGRFDSDDLDRKLGEIIEAQGRALVIINTPCHNPTGYSLDVDEWAATNAVLTKHAKRAPVVLLLDVAYAYYAFEALGVAIEASKAILDDVLVLYAWSASKSFAQYGLRTGALIATTPSGETSNASTDCRNLPRPGPDPRPGTGPSPCWAQDRAQVWGPRARPTGWADCNLPSPQAGRFPGGTGPGVAMHPPPLGRAGFQNSGVLLRPPP